MEEKKSHKVNSDLFKGEIPKELRGETYYAYLDSIEQIKGVMHIRFDCVIKNSVDEIRINKESILNLPSIVIEISGSVKEIRARFNYDNLYLLESHWMLIKTEIKRTSLLQRQFFNFIEIGYVEERSDYNLGEVIRYRYLDNASKNKINELIEATTLEESSEEEVKGFLNGLELNSFEHINIYNVGQGNCNALVKDNNQPLLYYDVGGGFGSNRNTYPPNFTLCKTNKPPVILSHWDIDHIQTAVYAPAILKSKWLVPTHSSISNTAMHIAEHLRINNKLTCWNNNLPVSLHFSNHEILKCSGNSNNKNNSGLALFISYGNDEYVLLPGDASFRNIPSLLNKKLIGLVASHHGSNGGTNGMPNATHPSMLVYSYGNNNTYHHAHNKARIAYQNGGWMNFRETVGGNVAIRVGLINNDTPCNGRQCTLNVMQHF